MSRETVRMARLGIRPRAAVMAPIALAERAELAALRDKVLALRGDLSMAWAQRNAAQAALDKANRDNDALRAELRKAKQTAAVFEKAYKITSWQLNGFLKSTPVFRINIGNDGALEWEGENESMLKEWEDIGTRRPGVVPTNCEEEHGEN
jgi:hypothetical protein